jgi:hypothetical protein
VIQTARRTAFPTDLITHPQDADTRALVRARGVTKRFGDPSAVEQVDLTIGLGEIFGLCGFFTPGTGALE